MAKESQIIIAQGIKVDNTYKNVLSYNQEQMLELVSANKIASANNYSFIREFKNTIQVGFPYSQICNANYLAFQNKDYNNRWFFAFISDVQFINANTTNIVFETDVWSTFYDSMNVMKCFVEREHVNNDTIGLHTVPEGIATGDMVVEKTVEDSSLNLFLYVGVLTDWDPISTGQTHAPGTQFSGITIYNKGVFGHQLFVFKWLVGSGTTPDLTSLLKYIFITNHDGHIADIKDMFIIPSALINESQLDLHECNRSEIGQTTYFWTLQPKSSADQIIENVPKVHSFNNITVKNNKCFVYPYNYILATNNNGNQNIYKYELFSDPTNATFRLQLALTIGISGRCVPYNYNGQLDENDDEAIPLGKYPTCNWSADSYTNWLTQQAVNIPTKIVGTVIKAGTQMASGDVAGAGVGTAMSIAGMIGEFYSAGLQPNIEGGGNTGDVVYSAERNTITFKCMRPKLENLQIIDSYFNRFGYKINETKTPNLTGRQYWNYIKIGGSDRFATGNIQTKFLDVINNIAQQGTTIWHSHDDIGNYDLNNTIV